MKITYIFADNTVSEVEVSEEVGTLIMDSRRMKKTPPGKNATTAGHWMPSTMRERSMASRILRTPCLTTRRSEMPSSERHFHAFPMYSGVGC